MVNLLNKFIEKLAFIFKFNRKSSHNQNMKIKGVQGKVNAANVIIEGDKHAPRKKF